MNAAIFIVTHNPHLPYFRLCAKSIVRHVTGFSQIVVVVPTPSYEAHLAAVAGLSTADGIPFTVRHHFEANEKGHWWMNATKVMADIYCPLASMIAHLDADCVFTQPTTPESYMAGYGRIAMLVTPFEKAGQALCWKAAVDRALGIDAQFETMQSPQLAYDRTTYAGVRRAIESLHAEPFLYCALTHHVPEFPTLGAYALLFQAGRYEMILRGSPEHAAMPKFVLQGWSHHVNNPETLMQELARLEAAIG